MKINVWIYKFAPTAELLIIIKFTTKTIDKGDCRRYLSHHGTSSFNQLKRILKEYYTASKKVWSLTKSTSQKCAQNYKKHLECRYNKNAKCKRLTYTFCIGFTSWVHIFYDFNHFKCIGYMNVFTLCQITGIRWLWNKTTTTKHIDTKFEYNQLWLVEGSASSWYLKLNLMRLFQQHTTFSWKTLLLL